MELAQVGAKVSNRTRPSGSLIARLTGCDRIYKGIVNYTAKQGYRADLRQEAVARASAVLLSQQDKKELPEKKVRGAKARAAAEKDS